MPTIFEEKVYSACRKIPKGKVSTYKEIAKQIKCRSCQAVGNALRKNPYAPQVPCHRVVRTGGKIGGFNGKLSGKPVSNKIALLSREGVATNDGRIADFEKKLFRFAK
ncbi:MAG: MGMT family protein [Candidatus Woesearchaeota archaeon]